MSDRRDFAYHRSLSPTIGMLLALAIVELGVVHLVVVGRWGWWAALIAGVLDASLVVALVRLLRSFRRLPVTLVDGVLTMRAGSLKSVAIPVAHIAGLRPTWDAAALKERGVLNLALASWPSVVIDLDPPVVMRRGRQVRAVAHKLDDTAAFRAAIEAVRHRS